MKPGPGVEINYFPNPMSISTNVSFEFNQIKTFNNYLWLFDLFGKEISSYEFNDIFFTIKSPINKGIYIVRIFVNKKYYTFKLIVLN